MPGLPSPDGAPNPARGDAAEVDPVPTGAITAADGGVYVGLLTGAILWGTPGSAKILHITADGTISDAATGLDMVVSVAIGPDGTLYASQISDDLLNQPPGPGSVVRIGEDGEPETMVPGLTLPYGIAFDDEGNLLVVNRASVPPGEPAQGEVLRCDLDETAGEATPDSTDDAPATAASDAEFSINLVDVAFEPDEITIAADEDVTAGLVNEGVSPHTFDIDELDIHSSTIEENGADTVTINAQPGTYEFYCRVPGHKEAGMVGTLTVD